MIHLLSVNEYIDGCQNPGLTPSVSAPSVTPLPSVHMAQSMMRSVLTGVAGPGLTAGDSSWPLSLTMRLGTPRARSRSLRWMSSSAGMGRARGILTKPVARFTRLGQQPGLVQAFSQAFGDLYNEQAVVADGSAYFEHSYLAQRMGVPLVEGGDLCTGPDGQVFMRTISGLAPVPGSVSQQGHLAHRVNGQRRGCDLCRLLGLHDCDDLKDAEPDTLR